jgi:RCC1 and BTB domain-containing protein
MSENSFIDIRSHFDSNISIALSSNGFYCIWGQTDSGVIKVPKETDIKSFHEIYSLYLKNKVIPKPVESDKKQKHNRVLKKLIESFNNPENSDLKIKIKDQYIYVHKTVLKLFCNHFISMLSVNWTESESNEIEIKEYSYSVYYSFLKYIYTDSIDIKAEEVNEILDLANSYFEEELKQKCIHFIINGISVENACDMYSIAVKYESQELENYCLEFASNKWNEIIVSDGYQNMDKTLLMKFMTKAANMKLFK